MSSDSTVPSTVPALQKASSQVMQVTDMIVVNLVINAVTAVFLYNLAGHATRYTITEDLDVPCCAKIQYVAGRHSLYAITAVGTTTYYAIRTALGIQILVGGSRGSSSWCYIC